MGAVPFMYIGTCFLGPVAILRYIYCIIVIMPVFLYMILRHRDETGEIINS